MQRTFEIDLTVEEKLNIVRQYCMTDTEVVKALLTNPIGFCPFPVDCDEFPCSTLSCNADCCSNGYAYRQS